MEYLPEKAILATGISLFKILGEFTSYKWQTSIKIYRLFNCSVFMLHLVLLLANLFEAEGYMYVQIFDSIGSVAHGLIKYVCLFSYTSDILDLVRKTGQFYNIPDVKEVYLVAKSLLSACKLFQKVMITVGAVSIQIYFLKPITAGVTFIFPSRIFFDSLVFETVVLFSQYYILLIIAIIVPAYDIIYVSYSVLVLIQLRILKYKFEHISQPTTIGKICEYIRYHQLLLSVFNKMYSVYLWMFFFMYILTLISACVQLYMLLLGGDQIADLVMACIYVVALLLQLSVYTFPVEEIVFQFSEISSAIYKSPWYKRTLEDRKILLFVMMKAQRQNYLSAGGMIEMNVNTFTSVIRKAFSFYAILRNVLSK